MGMRLSRVLILVFCAGVPFAGLADEVLRCGGKLVQPGMSRAEVLQACGEPTAKTVEVQDVRSGNQVVGKTEVQRWTYASYSTTRVLVFDQDTLKAIE